MLVWLVIHLWLFVLLRSGLYLVVVCLLFVTCRLPLGVYLLVCICGLMCLVLW